MEHIIYISLIFIAGFACYKSGGQNKMAKQCKAFFEEEKKKYNQIIERKRKYGR